MKRKKVVVFEGEEGTLEWLKKKKERRRYEKGNHGKENKGTNVGWK